MKRLAGGENVQPDTEPWFATLVRLNQNKNSNNNRQTKNEEEEEDFKNETISEDNLTMTTIDYTPIENNTTSSNLEDDDIINYNNIHNPIEYDLENHTVSNENRPFCGGTLISDQYIVTLAKCVKGLNLDQFLIILNLYSLNPVDSRDMIKFRPSKIIIHPNYDEKEDLNNIALVRLARNIEFRFDLNVVPLCLVKSDIDESSDNHLDYYPGYLYTLGFGQLFNGSWSSLSNIANSLSVSLGGIFQQPQSPQISPTNTQNAKQFPNRLQIAYFRQEFFWCFLFYPSKFMENRICTSDNRLIHLTIRDVCEKDSGGGLVWFNRTLNAKQLIGISQSGKSCNGFYPAVFIKIRPYLDWISDMTIDSEYCRYPDF